MSLTSLEREGIGGGDIESDQLGVIPATESAYHADSRTLTVSTSTLSTYKQPTPIIIIDSGCTAHMMPYRDGITRGFHVVGGNVMLGNNHKLAIRGIGGTNIKQLRNILWVPDLNIGLISVSVLDKHGYNTIIQNGQCTVYDNAGMKILVATVRDKLYYLDEEYMNMLFGNEYLSLTTEFTCKDDMKLKENNIEENNININENNINKVVTSINNYNNYSAFITNHLAYIIYNNVITDNPLMKV